jgi:hypothetical protein
MAFLLVTSTAVGTKSSWSGCGPARRSCGERLKINFRACELDHSSAAARFDTRGKFLVSATTLIFGYRQSRDSNEQSGRGAQGQRSMDVIVR